MAERVLIEAQRALDDHAEYAHLAAAVTELRNESYAQLQHWLRLLETVT